MTRRRRRRRRWRGASGGGLRVLRGGLGGRILLLVPGGKGGRGVSAGFLSAGLEKAYFEAVDDAEPAVFVDNGDVPRALPAAFEHRFRSGLFVFPVAGADVGAFDVDFAALAGAYFLPVLVDEFDVAVRHRHADAAGSELDARGRDEAGASDFGHAPALADAGFEALGALGLEGWGEGRGAGEDFGDGAEVVVCGCGVLAHEDEDRRRHLDLGDAVVLDDPQHLFVVEHGHDVDWDVEFGGHEHDVELGVGVVEGQESDPALVGDGVFACAFELGFLGVFEEDGLFGVGDEVVVRL